MLFVPNMRRSAKMLILNYEGITKKNPMSAAPMSRYRRWFNFEEKRGEKEFMHLRINLIKSILS